MKKSASQGQESQDSGLIRSNRMGDCGKIYQEGWHGGIMHRNRIIINR